VPAIGYRLRIEPEWELARGTAARQRAWQEILRPLGAELFKSADTLAKRTIEQAKVRVPVLFPDRESIKQGTVATTAVARSWGRSLELGSDPATLGLVPELAASLRWRVRRGHAFSGLTRTMRIGHETVADWLFARIAQSHPDQAIAVDAVQLGSVWMFACIDRLLAVAQEAYDTEHEQWSMSASAGRADVIDAIIDGREPDERRASTRLRYELGRNHVAMIVWKSDPLPGADSLDECDAAASEIAEQIGADGVLLRPLGVIAAYAWISRRAPFDLARLDRVRLSSKIDPGMRIAFGAPGAGLAGFRVTHEQAQDARRVWSLSRSSRKVTQYARVAMAAIATADPDQARMFVAQTLGGLAADGDVARRLSATALLYLEENASPGRVAKRLRIHENTVTYRVKQAEAILGHPLDQRPLELKVALALLPALRNTS
jgi:DNA-binding PucR family transcriptional regulator